MAADDTTDVLDFYRDGDNYIWYDYLFTTTELVSGQIATTYYYCGVISVQTVDSFETKYSSFDNFTLWLMSLMQNVMGNVISF